MLAADDQLEHALELAYRYLNRRDRSETEMMRHLERKGLDAQVAARAVCALAEQGYLDDARFARLFVQDKRELEQWGSERIRQALVARGIDRDLIDQTLAEHPSEDGDLERAMAVLRRRFPTPPADRRQRERARGILLRKGYDSDLVGEAVSSYARER